MPVKDNTRIIFVVGRPRSGTNFIRSILNLHTEIWISGEPKFYGTRRHKGVFKIISHLYPFETQSKIDSMFSMLRSVEAIDKYWTNPKLDVDKIKSEFEKSEREYRDLMWITLKERARVEGKSIFGEKTPSNLHRIPTLLNWFPEAKFLHIIRDPRAVFVSEINRKPNGHYFFSRSNALSRLLIFIYTWFDWLRNIRLHRKYQSALTENYIFIRFSMLYSKREEEIRRICEFIEVDFEDTMLNPPRRGSNFPADYDPLNGWREKMPRVYRILFKLLLGHKIKKYS